MICLMPSSCHTESTQRLVGFAIGTGRYGGRGKDYYFYFIVDFVNCDFLHFYVSHTSTLPTGQFNL